ncbi:MAG: ABC transporter permease [Microcella sp.]|nr:ABC transporter permease [Microcella sp.]
MRIALDIMARNLTLFFRDRMAVMFSLLGAIIVLLLYALFLSDIQTSSIVATLPDADESVVRGFIDGWMFGGIIAMTSITTSLGALAVFVDDSATGRLRDFMVSPIRRGQLVFGYLLSTAVISVVMTSIVFLVSLVYLFVVDGVVLDVGQIARTIAWVVLSCLAYAALWSFVAAFVRTAGAYSGLSTVVGTLIGFLAGAFIAVGLFPEPVRNLVNALPFAQSAMLIRREFATDSLAALVGDETEVFAELSAYFGLTMSVGGFEITVPLVIATLALYAVVFTTLAAWRIRARIA